MTMSHAAEIAELESVVEQLRTHTPDRELAEERRRQSMKPETRAEVYTRLGWLPGCYLSWVDGFLARVKPPTWQIIVRCLPADRLGWAATHPSMTPRNRPVITLTRFGYTRPGSRFVYTGYADGPPDMAKVDAWLRTQ